MTETITHLQPFAPSSPVESTPVVDTDAIVETWVASLRDSPLSRSTEAWNYLVSMIPKLKTSLKEI